MSTDLGWPGRGGAQTRAEAWGLVDDEGRLASTGGDWARLTEALGVRCAPGAPLAEACARAEGAHPLAAVLATRGQEVPAAPAELALVVPGGRTLRCRVVPLAGAGDRGRLVALEEHAGAPEPPLEEEVLRGVVARSAEAVGVIDLEGRYLVQNDAHRRLLGWSDEELRGQTPALHLGAEAFARIAAALVAEGRFAGEVRSRTRSGEVRLLQLEAFPVLGPDGRPTCFVGIKRDLEQRRAADVLRQSEARLRELAAALPGVVYQLRLDPDGARSFPFVSEGVGAFGLDPRDVQADPDAAFSRVHPEDRPAFEASIMASARSLTVWSHEFRLLGGGAAEAAGPAAYRWVHATSSPRRQPDGAIVWSGVVLDVTARKAMERDLELARDAAEAAARARARFLANVSHEIRTPLNAVLGTAALLQDGARDPEQREGLELIRRSGDALVRMLDQVLDLSKIESGRLEVERQPFDLEACLDAVVDLMAAPAAERGLTLAHHVASDVPRAAVGDEARLRQVLVNLLSNAIKFTERGEVTLEVARAPAAPGAWPLVTCAVRDTGIGIPADRLDGLFQPFNQLDPSTTRRYGGTGLGLAISRRLVELMDGRIEVETAPGVGSTFRVHLPLEPVADPAGDASSDPQDLAPGAGRRAVLLAEGDGARALLARQLRDLGLEVEAPAVLAALRGATDTPPDLLVVARSARGADEPLRALTLARARWGDGPRLVLVTDRGRRESDRLVAGVDAVVSRPVHRRALARAVAAALEAAGPRPLQVLALDGDAVGRLILQRLVERLGHRVRPVATEAEADLALAGARYDLVLVDQAAAPDGGAALAARLQAVGHPTRVVRLVPPGQATTSGAGGASGPALCVVPKPVRLEHLAPLLARP